MEKPNKTMKDEERLELAAKLDTELDDFINNLEKKRYIDGWPEDRWEEEMDKHPFFMKKPPKPSEELSPLMEGLQQLKFGTSYNTAEELAKNYKDEGNFHFKFKKYRLAILSYTEGIKSHCANREVMAQLYNNRATAHFMMQNYRTCLYDSTQALVLRPNYLKPLSKAATCCLHLKKYDECVEFCDQFLAQSPKDEAILLLRSKGMAGKETCKRNERKMERLRSRICKQEDALIKIIESRGVKLELIDGIKKPNLKDLESKVPEIAQSRVHLDEQDKLVWPVMILYPEKKQMDYIQNFEEDTTFFDQLEQLFAEAPKWDTKKIYKTKYVNVYYEGEDKSSIHKIDIQETLGTILRGERFVVRGGTPVFFVLIRSSPAEKRLLSNY